MPGKDNKDKEKLEDTNINTSQEDKENNDDKKEFEKKVFEVRPEELDKFLTELKEKYELKDENIRIVRMEKRTPGFKQSIIQSMFVYLIDLALVIAIAGYTGFARTSILPLIIVSLAFSTIELIFKWILLKYLPKVMFYSFGTALIPVTIISFLAAFEVVGSIISEITLVSTDRLILFLILFMIIRIVASVLLMMRQREIIFNKLKGGKK